ncbi:MAG: hypothetical protein D6727_02045, partial [Gammaproteobacteria bacterium]
DAEQNAVRLTTAAVLLAALAICAWHAWPYLANGQLLDADSYTWLSHAQRLLDGQGWYDHRQPRANWPDGERQHSSRPFVLLLLAGATLLGPWLGKQPALFWTGAWLAPLLFLATALATGRLAGLTGGPGRAPLAVLLLACQFPALAYGLPGRADHHALIMLVFALSAIATLRMLRQPGRAGPAMQAGLLAGFGVWLSPEFLLALVGFLGLPVIAWAGDPDRRWRNGLLQSLGMLLALAVAIGVEYRPEAWLAVRYDRISVAHLAVAAVASAFWLLIGLTAPRGGAAAAGRQALGYRLIYAGLLGLLSVGGFALLFPGFFAGPVAGMDPRAKLILVDLVQETGGLLERGPLVLLLYLGGALLAAPVVAERLWRDRDHDRRLGWLLCGLLLLVYVPLSLFMLRFAPYAAIVAAAVLADGLVRLAQAGRRWLGASNWLAVWLPRAGAASVAGLALGLALFTGRSLAALPPCHQHLKALAEYLARQKAPDGGPLTIVAMADMGPELLYRTPHRVIATPSLSNQAGAIAMFEIFDAVDDVATRPILRDRGINAVLICRALPFNSPGRMDRRLYARLMYREVPFWLVPQPLPPELASLYEWFLVKPQWLGKASVRPPAARP